MTHERKSATWSVSCSARGDCLHFAFLVKIFCKHGAFHSIWESEICFVLCIIKRNEAKIFRTNCWKGEHSSYSTCFIFEAIYILKCWTHFWFCGLKRIAWRWYTGSRKLFFLQNGFFSQSLTYTPEIYEYFWYTGILTCSNLFTVKTWDVATEMISCCMWMLRVTALIMHFFVSL